MKSPAVLGLGRTLVALAVCLAIFVHRVEATDEHLYPHAERQSGPWGYIDKSGRIVIPLQYQGAQPFSEGLAAVSSKNKYGFIDRTGRVVIDFQFGFAQPFREGRAIVTTGYAMGQNTWAMIDRDGHLTAIPNATRVGSFSEGRAVLVTRDAATNKEKAGVIDLSGRVVIEPEYEGILPFSEGFAAAQRNGKWGFVDKDGGVVVPFQYSWATSFSEGRAKVQNFQRSFVTGFIDKTGSLAIRLDFAEANGFKEGLATVRATGKDPEKSWGAIDSTGKIVIPPQFADVGYYDAGHLTRGAFSEGLLAVSNGRDFGYVDKQGLLVIQPQFAGAFAFQEGLAVVRVRGEVAFGVSGTRETFAGVIDRSGQFLVKPIFDGIKIYPGGMIHVWYGDRRGYFDATGRPLTFSPKDIDDYVAPKGEQLRAAVTREREDLERLHGPRPPPGRAIVGKAGDTEYYLRLPEGMCALDHNVPQDRKFIEDMRTKGAAELEAAKKKMPQLQEETWLHVKKTDEMLKANSGLIVKCDQLEKHRSGGDAEAIRTYILASGMQKDHYDRSAGAGLVYMAALFCRMADTDAAGAPRPKDNSARVWNAFKRLEEGETTVLPALAFEGLACYSAGVAPATDDQSAPPQTPPMAKVIFHTIFVLPDWLVQVFTQDVVVASPDALFRELQHEKTLVRVFEEANLKRSAPSTRP